MQLSAEDSAYLRGVVLAESAIVLDESKDYLLESRLGAVLRANGLATFSDLVSALRRQPRGALCQAVIDAMTTNETSFFRDVHPWETLQTELLPQLVDKRSATRQLNFLCAACSSGQEPYSLAMTIREHFPIVASSWNVRIIGTDLSTEMVERTKLGKFSQMEVGRGMPAPMQARYFTRAGMQWQAQNDLRSMVEAQVGNLADSNLWGRMPLLDGIFLRNVLIYFSNATKNQILRLALQRLKPGGFLLLGSSETMLGLDQIFEREMIGRTVVYRRPGDNGADRPARATSLASPTAPSRPTGLASASPRVGARL